MGNINDRVKELRKNFGLTQDEFAKKIKLETSNAISMIERGKAKLTEQNILLICTPSQIKSDKTVSESWLRNGEGEMFIPYTGDNTQDHQEHELLEIYRNLLPPNRKVILDNSRELLKAQKMIIGFKTENTTVLTTIQNPKLIQTAPPETVLSPAPTPEPTFPLEPRYHVPPPGGSERPPEDGFPLEPRYPGKAAATADGFEEDRTAGVDGNTCYPRAFWRIRE